MKSTLACFNPTGKPLACPDNFVLPLFPPPQAHHHVKTNKSVDQTIIKLIHFKGALIESGILLGQLY